MFRLHPGLAGVERLFLSLIFFRPFLPFRNLVFVVLDQVSARLVPLLGQTGLLSSFLSLIVLSLFHTPRRELKSLPTPAYDYG